MRWQTVAPRRARNNQAFYFWNDHGHHNFRHHLCALAPRSSVERVPEMTDALQQRHTARRWLFVGGAVLITVVVALAIGESLGWPFLAQPLQRLLSAKLNRRVSIFTDGNADASDLKPFQLRFIGGLQLQAPQLEIAAPPWSAAPHMLSGRDVTLELRYSDLWRTYRGQPLRIHRLQAATLDGYLERLMDGRASWQFGQHQTPPPPTTDPAQPRLVPVFGSLQVANGLIRYKDLPLAIDVEARLSLANGASAVEAHPVRTDKAAAAPRHADNVFQLNATGRYRDLPLKVEMVSTDVLPWSADEALPVSVPLTLNATVGGASLVFKGSAMDALHLGGFNGRFTVKGPSLAAVGDPLSVTLPTTGAFRADGAVVRQGDKWKVVIDDATVGASRLNGAFTYDAGRSVRLLSGRLGGARLLLTDLGPVVGSTAAATAATAALPSTPLAKTTRAKGMVLPDRPFDLASLRAMDANVLIDIGELDLKSRLLEPLRPLHAHLQLTSGVLTLSDIDTRTGQGKLMGVLSLDGRGTKALWTADLRWDGVRLERWIHQARAGDAPPFVSGRLNGQTALKGQGRSTAEILASLGGKFRTEVREGAVSHLAVEMAGLDIAQGLGVWLKGDDALPVQCAVADLVAADGIFRPRVMVLDTAESAIWVEGSLSLATEALDLRAVVTPKDFSPLTLRTPLLVRGTFADPVVSIEKGPLGRKLATSFLLALVNPLAALIPLIDRGDPAAAKEAAAGCVDLTQRSKARLAVAAPVR